MSLQAASQAFGTRAAHHAQRRVRRIALLATAAAVLTALVIAAVIDATRTRSGRRYAHAMQRERLLSAQCDASLGKRRLWVGGVVTGRALCVAHNSLGAREDAPGAPDDVPMFSFLVVGDWGRDGLCCQRDVALEMARVAARTRPAFIASAGDNFYERGVLTAHDGEWDRSWRDVYLKPHEALRREWKLIVGNHDYLGDVAAQLAFAERDPLWYMPRRYYFETVASGRVFIAFLDTTCMYYIGDEFSQFNGAGLTSEYRDEQLEALKNALASSDAEWKLVVGHHPFFSSGDDGDEEVANQAQLRATLRPILMRHGVAAYISGHEHMMEHFEDDGLPLFVSGAGSKVRPVSVRQPKSVFSLGRQGFLQVGLYNASDVLHFRFIDMSGAVVHSATVPHRKAQKS